MTDNFVKRPTRVRPAGRLVLATGFGTAILAAAVWCGAGWAQEPAPGAEGAKPPIEGAAPVASQDAPAGPSAPVVESAKPQAVEEPLPAARPAAPRDMAHKEPSAEGPVRVTFNFRFQPWEEVLEWFADQAGYSLVMDAAPPGTFNYSDSRSYTPADAIDLLNGVLLTKGYTLVLRDRMLMLVNLEDGVPPNLVDTVSIEELDKRGEYELVSCLFHLENLTAEEAQLEVEKLIGPQGSVVVLPRAREILVTETAGKLRTIHEVITRADASAETGGDEKLQWFDLQFASAEEVLMILRQLFNIPADQNVSVDGTIRLALDPLSSRLLVSGEAQKLDEISKVLEVIDQPGAEGAESLGAKAAPQLEVYETAPADPDTVLKVMQTLLVGRPGVRLSTDPKTGNLVALARPEDHATILATINQMKQDAQRMEVFRLRTLDPQLAVLAIGKLFAADATRAPSVDADPVSRQLFVRGSQAQIDLIRSLLEKMGEGGAAFGAQGNSNVRMVPLSGPALEAALKRLEQIWPTLHPNPIRVMPPSGSNPPSGGELPVPTGGGIIDQRSVSPEPASPQPAGSPSSHSVPPDAPPAARPTDTIRFRPPVPARFVLASDAAPAASGVGAADAPVAVEENKSEQTAQAPPAAPGAAPIVVAPGPGGIMIASDDPQALDDFERLLNALAGNAEAGPKVTVFYLKYAKAQVVADTLSRILAGSVPRTTLAAPVAAPPAAGTNPAAATPSAATGGVLGYSLSPGGTGSLKLAGSVQVTADPRLNALLVQAAPADVSVIEQLLKVLDQRDGPDEILAQPKPRLIPVYNTQATEVVEIIRQVYQDRMVMGAAGGGGRGFNPMEFLQMMRGRGSDSQQPPGMPAGGTAQQADRLSLGVDARTNSVIVCAADPLFQEVRQLVEQLDEAATETGETVGVVSLNGANPQVVQQALAALMGSSVQVGTTSVAAPSVTSTRQRYGRSGNGSSNGSGDAARDLERMQRRMEFFRSLRGGDFGGRDGRSSGRSSSR